MAETHDDDDGVEICDGCGDSGPTILVNGAMVGLYCCAPCEYCGDPYCMEDTHAD